MPITKYSLCDAHRWNDQQSIFSQRYGFLLPVGMMAGEEANKFSILADCVKPRIVWLWNSSFYPSFLVSAATQVMDCEKPIDVADVARSWQTLRIRKSDKALDLLLNITATTGPSQAAHCRKKDTAHSQSCYITMVSPIQEMSWLETTSNLFRGIDTNLVYGSWIVYKFYHFIRAC